LILEILKIIFGTEKHIIPDIVLFINGLPLVVVECKSPATADPIGEAITQLMRYSNRRGEKEGNEKLFWYNLFTVATSKQIAKIGTITSQYEDFVEWKDPYPYTLSDISKESVITSQQLFVQGMLSIENLLEILHSFTIFKEDSKGGVVKIVPRYQQFRAVKKVVKKIKEGKTPKERGGIIWHTQGSGKSMTMMYAVRVIYHDQDLSNFKVVFITDRKDLERQLRDTSKSVGYTVKLARSISELKELLKTDTPDLVMGMISKFQERELEQEFPLLNTSPNILVMIDEAHRTQYKLLGANLKKALPNSIKLAFTGTPIEKTEMTFGDYIDRYGIKQSVEDGVTVEIVYEGRTHSAELTNEEEANAKFEEVFHNVDADEKNKIMGKYTWRAYLEDEKVIKDKSKDMIEHYITHVFPNKFKSQVVATSRVAVMRYKKALEESLKEHIEKIKRENANNLDLETLRRLKVAGVFSGAQNDPFEYKEFSDEAIQEKVIKSFKMPFNKIDESGISGEVGIIVVNEMLITGFDAPLEQVMYLDNVIKEHNLLQAIARVNRVYKNKNCGFVVDYVGVLNHLKETLSIYADEDIEEISKVVFNKAQAVDNLRYYHNKLLTFFAKHYIRNFREDFEDCIELLEDEEIRDEFIAIVKNFSNAIDKILPDPEALKYIRDLKIANFIKESAKNRFRDDKLSIKDASDKVRDIVEEYLVSKGVNPKIPPTPLLSDEFLLNLKDKPSNEKNEFYRYAITDYIKTHYEEDPEFYERFSDKLKKVLEEYRENWDLLAHELENLRTKLKEGRGSEQDFGLDRKTEMPFLGLIKQLIFGKTLLEDLEENDINLLVEITKDIVAIIKRETRYVDFWNNYHKQKSLKSYIITNILLPKTKENPLLYGLRNQIAQRIIELAYHIYGEKHNEY